MRNKVKEVKEQQIYQKLLTLFPLISVLLKVQIFEVFVLSFIVLLCTFTPHCTWEHAHIKWNQMYSQTPTQKC